MSEKPSQPAPVGCLRTPIAAAVGEELPAPAELRPPPEHAGKLLHWVQRDGAGPVCWEWFDGVWLLHGSDRSELPRDTAHYRYLGPAEWDAGTWARELKLRKAQDEVLTLASDRIAAIEAENASLKAAVKMLADQLVTTETGAADPLPEKHKIVPEITRAALAGLASSLDEGGAATPPASTPAPLPLRALRGGDGRPR